MAEESVREAEIFVSRDDFKFNAAHFVLHEGGREKLHGHNYKASISLRGAIGADGYVVDFGDVKKIMRRSCRALHERFLCPSKNPLLTVEGKEESIFLTLSDGSKFMFPSGDCILLPIRNTTVEELADYLAGVISGEYGEEKLKAAGVKEVTVAVAELPKQEARVTRRIG